MGCVAPSVFLYVLLLHSVDKGTKQWWNTWLISVVLFSSTYSCDRHKVGGVFQFSIYRIKYA